jgi:DNA polymerase alpha subunit A
MADQRRKRLQELKELRASGKTRGSTYEVEEDNAIYDEVDNEGYREVVRERLLKDDFVVDDNGEGYVDNGRDEWESGHNYYSDEYESEGESKGKSKKNKKQKIETQSKPDGNINKMFQRAFVAAASNAVPKPKEVSKIKKNETKRNKLAEQF